MFVFVDETGTDKRLALRRYGYSLKRTRAVTDRQLIRGKRFSAIAAICLDGVIDVQITTHSVNGRSVVILDNATIHHVESAISLIEETGALAIYLPPYSPDLMPIEECISKVKAYIRSISSNSYGIRNGRTNIISFHKYHTRRLLSVDDGLRVHMNKHDQCHRLCLLIVNTMCLIIKFPYVVQCKLFLLIELFRSQNP